jgi:hypothetical protein
MFVIFLMNLLIYTKFHLNFIKINLNNSENMKLARNRPGFRSFEMSSMFSDDSAKIEVYGGDPKNKV